MSPSLIKSELIAIGDRLDKTYTVHIDPIQFSFSILKSTHRCHYVDLANFP